MLNIWVYKCSRDEDKNLAYGDWEEVFRSPNVRKWGDSTCTANPMSKKILNEKMKARDLIFAYQTDERSIVGTCRVDRMTGEKNDRKLYLQPLEWFEEPVPILDLKSEVAGLEDVRAFNRTFRGTFYPVSPEEGKLLAKVCGIGLDGYTAANAEDRVTDPIDVPPGKYPEGSTTRIVVNAYERSPSARSACIARYGYKCGVCKFDFAKRYGKIGKRFIHVHHLKLLSKVGPKYRIDPVKDLRPVCPNCHAMLHKKRDDLLSIDELKAMLRG